MNGGVDIEYWMHSVLQDETTRDAFHFHSSMVLNEMGNSSFRSLFSQWCVNMDDRLVIEQNSTEKNAVYRGQPFSVRGLIFIHGDLTAIGDEQHEFVLARFARAIKCALMDTDQCTVR